MELQKTKDETLAVLSRSNSTDVHSNHRKVCKHRLSADLSRRRMYCRAFSLYGRTGQDK
jgi:hypothetical protein